MFTRMLAYSDASYIKLAANSPLGTSASGFLLFTANCEALLPLKTFALAECRALRNFYQQRNAEKYAVHACSYERAISGPA